MAYTDATFQNFNQDFSVGETSSTFILSTTTASATATFTGTAGTQVTGTHQFPVFKSPTQVLGVRVYGITTFGSGVTGQFNFCNGTKTFGSCTLPAAGTFVDATIAAVTLDSHGVLSSGPSLFTNTNGEILMVNTIVGTGSGSAMGTYAIDLVTQNLFVT